MALVSKAFGDIITFTRASTGTFFNSAGTLTSAAIDAPRFDYNPSTLAAQGLLIEEARTNSIRNNTMVGAAAGTPGTDPTNWTTTAVAGNVTAKQIVSVGTENGINYIDIRYTTSGAVTFNVCVFETTTQIVAANTQTWAASLYVKLAGGSLSNLTLANRIVFRDAVGTSLTISDTNFTPTTAALSTQRPSASFTATDASTARVTNAVLAIATGATDFTLRIGLPQLELGAFATSVIPTTTTALTRNADQASVNTLSPWFNSTEGGIFVEWQSTPTLYARYLVSIEQAGTSATRIDININSVNAVNPRTVVGGAAVASLTGGTYTGGGIAKIAFGYKSADYASSFNGAAAVTATTAGALPSSLATMYLGSITGGTPVNGWLRRFTYYPRRPSNAELVTLST